MSADKSSVTPHRNLYRFVCLRCGFRFEVEDPETPVTFTLLVQHAAVHRGFSTVFRVERLEVTPYSETGTLTYFVEVVPELRAFAWRWFP